MKYTIKTLFFLTAINVPLTGQEYSNNTISLFLQDITIPEISKNDHYLHTYEICNLLNCKTLNIPTTFGIFATYSGYLSMSDENGEIKFPRKTINDVVNVLVTTKIEPVLMFKNTVAYWQVQEDTDANLYKFERKKDPETQLFFWEVTEKKLQKNKIPLHTVVIFSDPTKIIMPVGVTPTNYNTQLRLPNIYIFGNLNYIKNALFILTIKPFFRSVKKLFKERPLGMQVHLKD